MKIYVDERLVPYRTTKIDPSSTKAEIDGLLARWGIKQVFWNWEPEINRVYVQFKISEKFLEAEINPVITVHCPNVWEKRTRNKAECINWSVSMRCLWWFLKSHLEMAFVMQSSKAVAFLAYVGDAEKTLKDIIIPRLESLQRFQALPEDHSEKAEVITIEGEKVE